ncbi:MAG TPA: ABC transporter permease, partial [Magnetospirillaceae bacterium]|nr:ABC transporter permease [Magnetospirillaceae bacterium]
MLGNVFLTFYRVTTRHPLYAALDLLGLSFGVAVFVTLSLYVRYETSFERWLPHADEVYLARTRYTMPGKPTRAMDASTVMLMETLRSDYPDLSGVRLHETEVDILKGAVSSREREVLADGDFFKLFDLELIAGDKTSALSGPGRVLLSETMARKYLAHGEGVGATIRLRDSEGDATFVVAAILADSPHNTDFHFDIIRLLTPSFIAAQPGWEKWGRLPVQTYLRFSDKAQADRQEAAFDEFVDRHVGDLENGQPMHSLFTYRLQPLRSNHLSDPRSGSALVTLGLVALLALAVAAVNHVNLATGLAGLRAREVAVRRTLGGTRAALARQFLAEAMLTSLLAWIGGLSLTELVLPLLNQAAGLSLSLGYA